MNNYLTAAQLARHLQVTPATIHAWHRRGWIPGLRAGRRPVLFDLSDVLKLSNSGAHPTIMLATNAHKLPKQTPTMKHIDEIVGMSPLEGCIRLDKFFPGCEQQE